ncbi:MAG: hypothetical protein M4D80_02480 [Myxococcota bacterium]|nr:hypothetical protein [Myxococcota bacterium]
MKRFARVIVALACVWIAVLFVLGFVLSGSTGDKVAKRFGESVQGAATIGDSSLGLVLGSFSAEKLSVRRDDVIGKLSIDVDEVSCDLAPLGIALVDRSCGDLEIKGVKLELSTIAIFKMPRPKRKPFEAERVVIENADLAFSPSAFLPSLGHVKIRIEHAEAGPTTFKSPLSFLFNLQTLRAQIELPAGITLRLDYANGKLTAAGSLFGSTPVELPLVLPKIESTDDAKAELEKLVVFGKDLAKQLVAQKAQDLLQKLPLP